MSHVLTTAAMRWHGPPVDTVEEDLITLIDDVAADNPSVAVDPDDLRRLMSTLAELGIWMLRTTGDPSNELPTSTSLVVWERLGRYWPAVAFSSLQARVLADLARSDDPSPQRDTLVDIVAARRSVAVVPADAPHVHVEWSGDRLEGVIDRIDTVDVEADLVVLFEHRAVLVRSQDCRFTPVGRTGFEPASCSRVQVEAASVDVTDLPGDPASAVSVMRHGSAVIAAGIAGAAADTADAYVRGREQFGGPLMDLPTVRRSIADQLGWVRSCLAMIWGSDDGSTALPALLKHATDGAIDVAAAALQAHGGYGYLVEYPVERHLRDALTLRAATAGFRGTAQEET